MDPMHVIELHTTFAPRSFTRPAPESLEVRLYGMRLARQAAFDAALYGEVAR